MNTKPTLILLALAVLLGIAVFLSESRRDRVDAPPPDQAEKLLPANRLPYQQVQSLNIRVAGAEPIEAHRDPHDAAQWIQTKPLPFNLKAHQVNALIDHAAELTHTGRVRPGAAQSLADMGLDPPRAVIEYRGANIKPLTLALGKRAGAGRGFAAVGDPAQPSAEVFIVDDMLHRHVLEEDPRLLRSTALTHWDPGALRRLRVERRDAPTVEAARREGTWRLIEPRGGRADARKILALGAAVAAGSIDRFVEDRPADLRVYGLDEPMMTLTLKRADAGEDQKIVERDITVRVGAPINLNRDAYFAKFDRSPAVFTVRRTLIEKLELGPHDLRDPHAMPIDPARVETISLMQDDRQTVLERRPSGWAFGAPEPGFEADDDQVESLMQQLAQLKAEGFHPADAIGSGPPVRRAILSMTQSPAPDRLDVYRTDRKILLRRNEEPVLYEVDEADVALLTADPLTFRRRRVWDLAATDLATIELTRRDGTAAEHRFTRSGQDGSEWDLTGADPEAFRPLLAALTPLRAAAWVEKPAQAPQGQAEIELTATLKDGTQRELRVFSRGDDDPVARAGDTPDWFRLETDALRALRAELAAKTVIVWAADHVAQVRTDAWALRRDDRGLYSLRDGKPFDETRAAALFDALAGLRAQRFYPAAGAKIDLQEPRHRLTLVSRDGEQRVLSLWGPQDHDRRGWLGRLDQSPRLFRIADQAAEALTADPVRAETVKSP